MKNRLVIVVMLATIVCLGPAITKVFDDRDWVPVGDPPLLPEFEIITELPPPLILGFPGAARAWMYRLNNDMPSYLVAVFYQDESQGRELVNSGNGYLDTNKWRSIGTDFISVEGGEQTYEFRAQDYRGHDGKEITVWSQYRFADGVATTLPWKAKLYGLRDRILRVNAAVQVSIVFSGNLPHETLARQYDPSMAQIFLPAINEQLAKGSR